MFIACRDEILKNVSENLDRKLPDPCEVAEGLVYKLTGAEKDTEQDTVSILAWVNSVRNKELVIFFSLQEALFSAY